MPLQRKDDKSDNSTKKILADLSTLHYSIKDVITTINHSKDFNQTRNTYVIERLRLMIIFFAITVPASSVFDFILFETAQAQLLLVNRVILSAGLIVLFMVLKRVNHIDITRGVLTLSFVLPILFYVATSMELESSIVQGDIPLSFTMMPFLIIAMLGLFPLTISGGIMLLATIFFPVLILEMSQASSSYLEIIDKLWLLILFGGVSLWLQTGQLVMLMKLYRESTVDPLTGLINRRVLMRQIEQVSEKCNEEANTFSVMMLDLDHFKRINDTHGHINGDRVLVAIAQVLKRELRTSDIIARFGGEEFFIVLPFLPAKQAVHVAERIAQVIRESSVESNEGKKINYTTSIGVTQYRRGEAVSAVFLRVDELLYQAKDLGRDRVVCNDHLEAETLKAS
jgi:diguanylate cyclase (GGDEF)-like protein